MPNQGLLPSGKAWLPPQHPDRSQDGLWYGESRDNLSHDSGDVGIRPERTRGVGYGLWNSRLSDFGSPARCQTNRSD